MLRLFGTDSKNSPAPLQKLGLFVWLFSLGLHGLLLTVPIPPRQTPQTSIKKPAELVNVIQLKSTPSPASTQPTPAATSIAVTTPTNTSSRPPILASPITRVATSSIPTPVPSITQPEIKPQVSPLPLTPTPTPIESELSQPENSVTNTSEIGVSEIEGIPVDSSWQLVEQPSSVMAEANMFTQSNGQLHPDIVGKVVQVTGKSPDQVYEEFFSAKLESAKFQVEPFGTYVPGGGLYKLTRNEQSSPLYLTLAPTKDLTGTVITIWNSYPSPVQ